MKVKVCLMAFLVSGFFCRTVFSQSKEVLNLSLEECILKAMKNNLNVAAEVLNPELARQSIKKAKETFLPQFELKFGNDHQESPPYSWIQGESTITTKMTDYGMSIVQQIPTGGNFSLSLSGYNSDTTESFQLINPRLGSEIRLDFTQPLLKNFGSKVSRRGILLAEKEFEISDIELQNTLLETIYSVQEGYWNLVYAIENLKVKQQSLQLARDLVAKNKKEVQFGQLAPIEILNAEAVVAEREADLLQAEALIIRTEEELKVLVNIAAEGDPSLKKIAPQDKPDFAAYKISQEEALKQARDRRPDLKVIQKNIESRELRLSVARNQLLPSLDLKFSYWSPGLGGDLLLYRDNDPFTGIVVGTQKGGAGNALSDALQLLYNNWNVGLTLSIPLSSFLTKADFAYAQTDLNQNQIKLKNLEQHVGLEVSDAVRMVETNAKRVEAYRVARELAEKTLEAEVKKLQAGRSTNYFVLEYQDRLATARSNEVRSKIDYLLSVAKLDKAMGISLEKRNIKVSF